jgi:pimeloyl-ACP methyl ester carboxylesterase
METFTDVMNNINWEYRQGGRDDVHEAVVLLPSIYETTNCLYLLGMELLSAGHRLLLVNIPVCSSVLGAQIGFDLLLAAKQISRVHLIGVGFGGFLALHFAQFRGLSAEVLSLSLIAAFMDTTFFHKSGSFFARFTGKHNLTAELAVNRMPPSLRESVEFVKSELDTVSGGAVALRLKMRAIAPEAPMPSIAPERVLVLQPVDWAFSFPETAKPEKRIQGCRFEEIELGGCFPHLANTATVAEIVKNHLTLWGSTVNKEDEEVEEC